MNNFIFITEKGTKVYRKNNLLYFENESLKIKESIPFSQFEAIIAFTKFDITTSTINFITSKNKSIFLLNKLGKIKSLIVPEFFVSNTNNRMVQYKLANDETTKLKIAKHLIVLKLFNIVENGLKFFSYSNIPINKKVFYSLKEGYFTRIYCAKNIEELLGIEGNISKYMFASFIIGLNPEFKFKGRQYFPPPDPINALLSLTYSIFYNYLFIYVLKQGFDPYVGFIHKRRGSHAVFVSDILELYRPKLTYWIKFLIHKKFITIYDFYEKNGCFYLKKDSFKRFLRMIAEKFFYDSRKKVHQQALRFFNAIKEFNEKGKLDEIFIYV